MKCVSVLLLLTATFCSAQYNPLKDPDICGRPTCNGSGKFKYGPNTQQTYKYSVEVRSLFNGTSKNESKLSFEGTANLKFLSECNGLLTLKDLTLSEGDVTHPSSTSFSSAIGEFSLRFDFNDGLISEICPNVNEKNWVLNLKRGLLSMLHNSMKRFDLDHSVMEEDVRGKCQTNYQVIGNKETSLLIEKSKDLDSCESRSKLHSMVQSASYNFRTNNQQSESLLKSTSRCEISIDHHIYNAITCEETYILQPFSNQDAGASTIVANKLILIGEHNATFEETPQIARRVPLLYDHVPSPRLTHEDVKTSTDLIKKMCQLSTDDVQIEFSDLFTKFIQTLRVLTPSAFSDLYRNSPTICQTGKKHMLAALPYVGTSAALRVMKDIILKKGVPENTVDEWMLSVSFTTRPDEEIMVVAAELLQQAHYKPDISLSVGALTHTFCAQNDNCRTNNAVDAISDYLESKIIEFYENNTTRRSTHDNIMVALKSLANIGLASERFKEQLIRIIEDETVDIAIRIAGVECHRRLPCSQSRSFFEEIYRNADMQSELRIAAYLQIMRCPNYLLIRTIRHTLEVEEVNQVGSFVWSHLNNLLKSADPSKVEIQGLLSDKDLVKKFSSDVRKFSHNREGSVFFEEFNVGANYDSNVIFSPSSYVPRSGMFNVSVDLFGQSVNLLEVYGRVEGLEHYIESIFGPTGPYSAKNVQDKIPKLRWARDLADNEVLKAQIDKLPNVMSKDIYTPKVALGMKVFGNDLKYNTFDGHEEIKEALDNFNPAYYFQRILAGKEINYNKATMFLDSSYVVPSIAGLPVSIAAVGTSSINLKLFGSFKADNFAKKRELDIKADIRPSISVDVTGSMSVDAFFASTGIKLKTSMYTSSAVDGYIKIRGFKLANAKFSVPRKTSEIFGARSELLVMKHNVEERQHGLKEHGISKSICSWPAVEKTVGLKLCADHHFMNVTKIDSAPYFLLAGPAGFRLYLQKSDPTANIYLFEYKWTDEKAGSAISISFDTEGTSKHRLLGANFTIDRQSRNLTLLLDSTAGTVFARGQYKNTPEEKYLRVALDVNKVKHFDTMLKLLTKPIPHGYVYSPTIYLGVNGQKVFDIKGSIKLLTKKGISQYGVDLKFQTKRVTSKVFGYFTKADASISSNFTVHYRFANTREQGVQLRFSLANRSHRNLMDIRGYSDFTSTAYPNFNAESKFVLLRGYGHTEFSINLTSNHKDPVDKQMQFKMLFKDKSLPDSTKIVHTVLSLSKSKVVNLKVDLRYQSKTPTTNIDLFINYGPDKQFSSNLFWKHIPKPLQQLEVKFNVSVPSFTPMFVRLKIYERVASDFLIDFSGTWFSGHSLEARGFYQDKSTARTNNHHVKLMLKSPSFQVILTDLQLFRDNDKLKINIKVVQNEQEYDLLLIHLIVSPEETATQAKFKYKTKVYSLTTSSYSGDHHRIAAEIHIDQIRDIYFAAWGHNKESYKAAGIELKWDANRDPNQKLVVSGNFSRIKSMNYESNLLISYPGRTLLGNFDFLLKSGHLNTLSRLSWDDDQSFALGLTTDYLFGDEIYLVISSELVTPFESWKHTRVSGGIHHSNNTYRTNGSIYWDNNQHVSIDLFWDYVLEETFLKCEFKSDLSSTLQNIPSLSATLSHSQNDTRRDTVFRIMYDPHQVIDVRSKWEIVEDGTMRNLTGTIFLTTPFTGFQKGYLISRISTANRNYVKALIDLDLDHKEFIVKVEGRIKKLTNSMLEINITTPIEDYRQISGRFGLSEEKKYLVSKITLPSRVLGIEILLSINSLTDFDTKFLLGTPLDFLQRIILVAKLKPEMADFRAGWNSLLGGFTGVWHYANMADFEYSYKIFTPIPQFQENSIVVKVILEEGLDFEVSAKLSERKVGVKVLDESKPPLHKDFGIKTKDIYGKKVAGVPWLTYKTEEDDENEDNPLSWAGSVEIDTLIYPTMKGKIDIKQLGPAYVVLAKITVPGGVAEITDEFEFNTYSSMKNTLHVTTPYEYCKIISSHYNLDVTPGYKYLLELNLHYQNHTDWIKTGFLADYELLSDENIQRTHNIILHVITPSSTLPHLDIDATLRIEKNVYGTNLSVATNSSDVSLAGNVKIDNGLLDTEFYLHAKTFTITIPPVHLKYKRYASITGHAVEAHLDIPKFMPREATLKSKWLFLSLRNFNSRIEVITPFRGMEKSIAAVSLISQDEQSKGYLVLDMNPLDVYSNMTITNNVLNSITNFTFSGNRYPVTLTCNMVKLSPQTTQLNGNLFLRDNLFKVTGKIDYAQQIPIATEIKLTPEDGSDPVYLEYKINPVSESGYKITGVAKYSQTYFKIDADTNIRQALDWDLQLKMETSHPIYKVFDLTAKSTTIGNRTNLDVSAHTPIPRLEHPKFGVALEQTFLDNHFKGYFNLRETRGNMDFHWRWLYMENMNLTLLSHYESAIYNGTSVLKGFFINPGMNFSFTQLGGDIQLGPIWSTGSNLTLALPTRENMLIEAFLKLPAPKQEVHVAKGKLSLLPEYRSVAYIINYDTLIGKKHYGSKGKFDRKISENFNLQANLGVDWQNNSMSNELGYSQKENEFDLLYKLATPAYKDKFAFVGGLTYQLSGDYHNITCQASRPEGRPVGYAKLNFKELANTDGVVNITIPYSHASHAGIKFSTETSAYVYNRYFQVFWPQNSAVLDGKCDIRTGATLLERSRKGKLIIEIPLATRHITKVDYTYEEKPQVSTGEATVGYNGKKVLDASYNCLSESRAGFDKETIHVELQNKLYPIGVDYVHGYEYGATREASSVDSKHLHLYHLKNRTIFDVEGDARIATSFSGQQIELKAHHSNRTIKLKSDYDILDQQFKQHSRLELAPKIWLEYDLNIVNKTENEEYDSQQVQIDVKYPLRNFTAIGSYKVGEKSISTDMSLKWDLDNKNVFAGLDWNKPAENKEELQLTLKHPSFEKDVTIHGQYEYDDRKLIDTRLKVDYAIDPDQSFILGGKVDDNSNDGAFNYTYNVWAVHAATKLNLNSRGGFYWSPNAYSTSHYTDYKRSYLPSQTAEALARVDFLLNEIELKRNSLGKLSYLKSSYSNKDPIYTANLTMTHDYNDANGEFYMHVLDYLINLEHNMTTDGSQSLHMHGYVPDSRSARFAIWRDYEEIKVSDVTYYLQMNHSRLIMSSLKWRPDLFRDLQSGIRTGFQTIYNYTTDTIKDTNQYVNSETNDALTGIWSEARPYVQEYLDHLRALRDIEDDIDEFRDYLNNSYNSNAFYVKDFVTKLSFAFDEMALKKHLQSVPAIVAELWEIMGESGKKLQQGIVWFIEKLKVYYKTTSEFIRKLLEGDPIEHLTDIFKEVIGQYDDFIKNIHVAFVQFMEKLWDQTYNLLVDNWYRMLVAIEPTILKLVHYLETILWSTGQEFLDFLYVRKSEIIGSPYFAKFTNFSRDLDRFYKDITGNNTISSVIKYSEVTWNFMNEKYLKKMPFGKELEDVFYEIVGEINQLRKLDLVKYLEQKYWEAYKHVKWFYEYFDVETRLQKCVTLVYKKLTDMSQTALQSENRYRVAKTKFIFEPSDGIMHLEQKLPMSWHAFNETPKFQEIPEVKAFYDIQNYFVFSQISFWNFYYDYKPYTDPSEWLPPFKAQAMLVGSKYYVTFDRRYYAFRGRCSYLLATDFKDRNFTLVASYGEDAESYKLLLILNKTVVEINVFSDLVRIRDSVGIQLPIQIGDTFIHHDGEIVTVESESGFVLECNMKFDVCTFEVSGWYYGKTAGLFGTINNEPSDDFLSSTSKKNKSPEINEFAKSWSLDKSCADTKYQSTHELNEFNSTAADDVKSVCDDLYINTISELSPCFSRVRKEPFLQMCLESKTIEDTCESAQAYSSICLYENTPVRIPDFCIICTLPNGTSVSEGESVHLNGSDIPNSADVVFLIEAKACNKDLRNVKNMDTIIEAMNKEFRAAGITDNRYSAVLFGSDGVYEEPRSRSVDGKIFADYASFKTYFNNISVGNGSMDIFSALTYATRLTFRPAVSKSFILMPCSECREDNMKFDYAILHQLLSEGDIKLHILMEGDLALQKTKDNKIPYGIDRSRAYTKKDIRALKGDTGLRQHVRLPKTTLGLCMPLAFETNGTLFNAKHLLSKNTEVVKNFASVFAKRVAAGSGPAECVECECAASSSGISYMECYPCVYPSRATIEMGFDDDEILPMIQPAERL